jgi:hypothetical protein
MRFMMYVCMSHFDSEHGAERQCRALACSEVMVRRCRGARTLPSACASPKAPLLNRHPTVCARATQVDLVVAWFTRAGLPQPWLQPAPLTSLVPLDARGAREGEEGGGARAAAPTPLVLAAASSPSGALLRHILAQHEAAQHAWRVPVAGSSGRRAAAAAGLWSLVLASDARAAVARVRGAVRRAARVLWLDAARGGGGGGGGGAAAACAAPPGGAKRAMEVPRARASPSSPSKREINM